MAVNEFPERHRVTRRFYLLVAILFPLIVLAGFAQTYYLKGFFDAPPVASMLVHLHGLVMTAWVILFITQVWFISSKRIKLHQKLGIASILLAVVVIVVGIATAIASAARGGGVPGIPPLEFLAVPFFDMIVFPILFGTAIYYRRRPANHKRLMLLTVLNFLPPAVARIPIASLQSLGPLWFFGFPDVLAIIFVIVDTWRHKKLNKVFLAGTLLLIVSHPLRLMLSGTDTWLRFAAWVTS